MMHRLSVPRQQRRVLLAAALWPMLSACVATAPTRRAAPADSTRLPDPPDPHSVGTIAVLDIVLPDPGTLLGGVFAGARFQRRVADLHLSEGLRYQLTRRARLAADSILVANGYSIRPFSSPTSDAEPMPGVRFAIVGTQSVVTVQDIDGRTIQGSARVAWELIDLGSGRSLLGAETSSITGADSADVAIVRALAGAFEALLQDRRFRAALGTPRSVVDDIVYGPAWSRALVGAREIVRLTPADRNVSTAAHPMDRVGAALVTLRSRSGPRRVIAGAMLITRDGLALAGHVGGDPRTLQALFPNGVESPARVIRERNGVALVQIACADPCHTLELDTGGWPFAPDSIFVLAAPPAPGDTYVLAGGYVGGACGVLGGSRRMLLIPSEVWGGEAIAATRDGRVFGIAVPRGPVSCGVTVQDALSWLLIEPEPQR